MTDEEERDKFKAAWLAAVERNRTLRRLLARAEPIIRNHRCSSPEMCARLAADIRAVVGED